MGGIGAWEILLVLAAILVFFGPEKVPEMARKLAELSAKLRLANRDFQREIYRNLDAQVEEERPKVLKPDLEEETRPEDPERE